MSEKSEKEDLALKYEELYGTKPSPKARPQYLQRKIDEKLQSQEKKIEAFKEKEELEKEELPNKIKQELKPVKENFEFEGAQHPFKQGSLHACILKGSVRYFSEASIAVIQKDTNRQTYDGFTLPEGSPLFLNQKKRGA